MMPPAGPEAFNLTATGGGCRLDNTGLSQTASVRGAGLDLTGAATPRLQLTAASGFRPTPRLDQTTGAAKPGLNLTGAAATPGFLGRSGCAAPPGLDLTGMTAGSAAPLGLNLTSATPGLGRAAAIGLNLTGAATTLDVTGGAAAVPSLNMSIADAAWQHGSSGVAAKRPGLDLTTESSDLSAVPMPPQQQNATWATDEDCDPFSPALHARLMSGLARPAHSRHGYVRCAGRLPAVREGAMLQLGAADRFFVSCLKGEGGFARVYAATKEEEEGLDSTIAGIDAVLKVNGNVVTCSRQRPLPYFISRPFLCPFVRSIFFRFGGDMLLFYILFSYIQYDTELTSHTIYCLMRHGQVDVTS
jgi:hypothetical protein